MFPNLRIPLIGFLLAVLSHAPIPWIHNHDGMAKEQLLLHLQQYHQGCPSSRAPVGWHCHAIQLAVSEDGANFEALAASRTANNWLDLIASPNSYDAMACLPKQASLLTSTAALEEANAAMSKANLFNLYETLLL